SASAAVNNVNIDKTAPTMNAHRDTAANANGWNNTNVHSSFTAGDGLSGLITPASGSFTFTAEGANQSHADTATDKAGNTVAAPIWNVNIDKTAPTLTLPSNIITAPNNPGGALVNYLSSGQDGLSGIQTFISAPGSGNIFAVGNTTVQASAT